MMSVESPDQLQYSAIIRITRCDALLERVVNALRQQSAPPSEILLVDSSGSAHIATDLQRLGCVTVQYPPEPFNFSKAINVGVAKAKFEKILVLSSHVVLEANDIIEQTAVAAKLSNCAVFYLYSSPASTVSKLTIDASSFDGRNGLSNSCAMLPRNLVTRRPFREDVFSAEDQEWAAWYFRERQGRSLRVGHPNVLYLNPHVNTLKIINEEIAIAYFAFRRNLGVDKIASRIARALLAAAHGRKEQARMHYEIAKALLFANFKRPSRLSKYY